LMVLIYENIPATNCVNNSHYQAIDNLHCLLL